MQSYQATIWSQETFVNPNKPLFHNNLQVHSEKPWFILSVFNLIPAILDLILASLDLIPQNLNLNLEGLSLSPANLNFLLDSILTKLQLT